MDNKLTTQEAQTYTPDIPMNQTPSYGNINQGTVAIESHRAIAEVQGKLYIAKSYPRDELAARQRINNACKRPGLASKAFYTYNRAGSTVSGPTIRFAEELARCWGNIDYGIKELSQDDGKSEMQAYAWDLETNAISAQNFTNPHYRETKQGPKRLTSQRDIYEVNANMGARRLRARILAILPQDVVEDAIEECKKTLAGSNEIPFEDKLKRMLDGFVKLGANQKLIETKLGHKMADMTRDEFVEFTGIFNAIKDGQSSVADHFESPKEASDLTAAVQEKIKGAE